MLTYSVKVSRSCTRRYRPYQRWSSKELCSKLSQTIRLNASVEHWLGEPILDPDKEHGEVFRYVQFANTAYCAQYPIKTTHYEQWTLLRVMKTKWKLESERLVIQRKQHQKLCCSSQQEKPLLTVDELKTFSWQPDEGRWSANTVQRRKGFVGHTCIFFKCDELS